MTDDTDPAVPETYTAEFVQAIRQDAERRVMLAELKAAALEAGMVDADGVKLLDLGRVTIGADGGVQIPDGFFEGARKAKPYLFAASGPARQGSTARVPAVQPPQARMATEMSFDEWQTARAELLRRR